MQTDSDDQIETEEVTETEEVIELCSEVLDEPYKKARDLHINNEAALGEHDWVGLTNFRDALDHLSRILEYLDEEKPEKAKSEVVEMQGHLYRAAYDGANTIPEAKIEYIENNRLPYIFYQITLVEAPSDAEFKQRKNQIRDAIGRGRQNKPENWKSSVKSFEEAKRLATSLEEETPDRKDIYYRMLILCSVE